jgi:hypothetical protein
MIDATVASIIMHVEEIGIAVENVALNRHATISSHGNQGVSAPKVFCVDSVTRKPLRSAGDAVTCDSI